MKLLNPILIMKILYVWAIDFMRYFPNSFGYLYLLVAMDFVSKWVEAVVCKTNDYKFVDLKDNVFPCFGTPCYHQ
jgi:hypothetical protein